MSIGQDGVCAEVSQKEQVDIEQPQAGAAVSRRAGILALPTELQWLIWTELSSVDLACLALSHRTLMRSFVGLMSTTAGQTDADGRARQMLLWRLDRGWIDRGRYRYCWQCQRFLPRNPRHYEPVFEPRLPLPWDPKVVTTSRLRWRLMSRRQRRRWLVASWCDGETEVPSWVGLEEFLGGSGNHPRASIGAMGSWRDPARGTCPTCIARYMRCAHARTKKRESSCLETGSYAWVVLSVPVAAASLMLFICGLCWLMGYWFFRAVSFLWRQTRSTSSPHDDASIP